MLALPHTNSWGFVYTNQAAGSTSPGLSVTPGASDVEGSWSEIGPDASITSDIYYVTLTLSNAAIAGQSKQHLLDFGWDPAGGTSYVAWFENLACGNATQLAASSAAGGFPRTFHFPCRIPAGSAIAVRIQGSNATAGEVRVEAKFWGKPSRPELWRPAAYAETLGYTAGTLGTTFTPGNAAFGNWASLGTTAKKHFWIQPGVQIDNGTQSLHGTRIQVGIGAGAAGDTHVISDFLFKSGTSEENAHQLIQPCTWEVPAGAEIWIRGANQAAPVTGYNATAVLFGG